MRANEQGFTLVETLVALVILTIAIFSLYSLQVMSVRGNAIASAFTQSSNRTVLQLERLLGGKFEDLKIADESHNKNNQKPDYVHAVDPNGKDFGLNAGAESEASKVRETLRKGCAELEAVKDNADPVAACQDTSDGRYRIIYNVAEDYPVKGVKTIRVHVYNKFRGEGDPGLKPTTYQMIRNNPKGVIQ